MFSAFVTTIQVTDFATSPLRNVAALGDEVIRRVANRAEGPESLAVY